MDLRMGKKLLLVGLIFFFSTNAFAKKYPWIVVSNDYFIAYTNAKPELVIGLLEELERFRIAAQMVIAVTIPKNTLKTRLIIFGSRKEFRRYSSHRNILGYMSLIDKERVVVMYASSKKSGSLPNSDIIRHEYVHVLSSFHQYKFPRWYEEGLAEFLSGIVFQGERFILGIPSKERFAYSPEFMSYQKLLSDDYDSHQPRVGNADPYAQYWLLTSYMLLGDAERRKQFVQYLTEWQKGADTLALFEEVFGIAPDDMYKKEMKKYSRNYGVYTGVLDLNKRSPFSTETARMTIIDSYLQALASMRKQ